MTPDELAVMMKREQRRQSIRALVWVFLIIPLLTIAVVLLRYAWVVLVQD